MNQPPSETVEWDDAEEMLSPEEFRDRLEENPASAFSLREESEHGFLWQEVWPAVEDDDLYDAAELLPEEQEYVIKFVDELQDSKWSAGTLMYDALQFVDGDEWSSRRQPDTVAAAAIRLGNDYTPLDLTSEEIAEVAGRTADTVNDAYEEAREELDLDY